MPQASRYHTGGRSHRDLSFEGGSCGSVWGCVFVGWTEQRISICTLECYERQVWLPAALATDILLRSSHPATSPAPLEGASRRRQICTGGFALSSEVQQRCETGQV